MSGDDRDDVKKDDRPKDEEEREKAAEDVPEGGFEAIRQTTGETAAHEGAQGEKDSTDVPEMWDDTLYEEWLGIPAAQREVPEEDILPEKKEQRSDKEEKKAKGEP